MNPYCQKLFNCLTSLSFNITKPIQKTALQTYGEYGFYLARNWSPRLSTYASSTEAYYPKRVQYSAYIVYFLVADFALYELYSQCKRQQAAEQKYLALRD